jgi:hypothetical protein
MGSILCVIFCMKLRQDHCICHMIITTEYVPLQGKHSANPDVTLTQKGESNANWERKEGAESKQTAKLNIWARLYCDNDTKLSVDAVHGTCLVSSSRWRWRVYYRRLMNKIMDLRWHRLFLAVRLSNAVEAGVWINKSEVIYISSKNFEPQIVQSYWAVEI